MARCDLSPTWTSRGPTPPSEGPCEGGTPTASERSGFTKPAARTRPCGVHGVVNECSVVVRTTETMVIYWECGTYRQRRYFSTKRGSVFVAMRALGSWAAPATCGRKRTGCRIAES